MPRARTSKAAPKKAQVKQRRCTGSPRRLRPGVCPNCGVDESSAKLWRTNYDPATKGISTKVCNSCGLYFNEKGEARPPSLWARTRRGRSASSATSIRSSSTTFTSTSAASSPSSTSCSSTALPMTPILESAQLKPVELQVLGGHVHSELGTYLSPGEADDEALVVAKSVSDEGHGGIKADLELVNAALLLLQCKFGQELVSRPSNINTSRAGVDTALSQQSRSRSSIPDVGKVCWTHSLKLDVDARPIAIVPPHNVLVDTVQDQATGRKHSW